MNILTKTLSRTLVRRAMSTTSSLSSAAPIVIAFSLGSDARLSRVRRCSTSSHGGSHSLSQPSDGKAAGEKSFYTELELVELSKKASEAFQAGDYATAIDSWEAVANSQNHSKNSPTLMSCLNNLACAYGEIGNNVKKVKLLEQSRELVEQVYGRNHPQYGMVLYNMACAKEEMGLYTEMTQLLEESLALHERKFNSKHAKVGRVLLLLASAYDHMGEHEKQLQTAQRAFEIVRRHCGPEHVQTTIAMMALARAYGSNAQPEKYLQTALTAFEIQEKKLGPLNPQLALTLLDLAAAYAANKDYFNQKEMLERAVTVQRRAFGKQHTYLIDTYIALAEANAELGETANMVHYYNQALQIARSRFEGKHITIGVAATKAATGALREGRMKKARALAAEAQDILSANVSSDHPAAKELAALLQQIEASEAENGCNETVSKGS